MLYIISLFISPLIGLFSIVVISYFEINKNIEWSNLFVKKDYKKLEKLE